MLDQYATYTNTYLEILASNLYTQREIEGLLRTVKGVLGNFVSPDIGWLDVMIPVLPKESDRPRLLIQQGEMGDVWLKVLYSAIRRTTRPTLIPTQVNLRPWRGSGNAYLSSGIDYVSSFQGRYGGRDYSLPRGVAKQIERQYAYWKQEHYFAALLAISIPAPGNNSTGSAGVLNLNFRQENPLGPNDTLSPRQSVALLNVLEPALQILATAISLHEEEEEH
ncbi:MAG TPA: hypothetical protein VK586_03275 [Streptosporangiaceae bacterium]|nr:hypothetical protein [Streptosporangiaceae bacterium]